MGNKYVIDGDAYARMARKAAAEGAVLLKNEGNVLPLKEGERLAVFGRIQFDYYKSGTGSGGMINTRYVVGILDALKEEKIVLNLELEQVYRDWLKEHPFDKGSGWAQEPWSQQEMPLSGEMVKKAAAESDTALVIIGRTAGEDRDAKAEKGSFFLSEGEEDMLRQVCEYKGDSITRPDFYLCAGGRVMDFSGSIDINNVKMLMELEMSAYEPDYEVMIIGAALKL